MLDSAYRGHETWQEAELRHDLAKQPRDLLVPTLLASAVGLAFYVILAWLLLWMPPHAR